MGELEEEGEVTRAGDEKEDEERGVARNSGMRPSHDRARFMTGLQGA